MYKAFNGGDVEALILNDLALKHATLKNKIKICEIFIKI